MGLNINFGTKKKEKDKKTDNKEDKNIIIRLILFIIHNWKFFLFVFIVFMFFFYPDKLFNFFYKIIFKFKMGGI